MSAAVALKIHKLGVRYGAAVAVEEISIVVPPGAVVSVVGANGAGKTTTLNAVMGLLDCAGQIELFNERIERLDTEDRVARGLALVPEKRALFATMSVKDNLEIGTYLRRRNRDPAVHADWDAVMQLFPRLRERLNQFAGTLSGGERQMLAIARALLMRPRVLMLDEPSLGLAPLVVREVLGTVASLRGLGVSVLLVEQNARAALAVSDYGYVLETGRVAAEGTASHLQADPAVTHAYLGGDGEGGKEAMKLATVD
jgi:branched-chain amino acid transport system ATP-binding protein